MRHLISFRAFSGGALRFAGRVLGCPAGSRAEPPMMRFNRLSPLGANAGTQLEVGADGVEFDAIDTLLFDHPGFKATLLKPRRFKLEVAAEVPEGTYDVWALGKYGISNPRLFAVSRGLTDVAKKEPNHTLAQAQEVSINVAIDGRTDIGGDYYRFRAKKGQRL